MEYTITVGKKEKFYVGTADLSDSKRLEIPFQDLRYPEFVRMENLDKEIEKLISEFFGDRGKIVCHKTSDSQLSLHNIFIANKLEFDEFDRE